MTTNLSFVGTDDLSEVLVAVQPDGKTVLVGETGGTYGRWLAMARLNTDGTLDDSFGEDGKVVSSLRSERNLPLAASVALQPDGKIVVAGSLWQWQSATDVDFAVARFNSDGSLDTTFGGDGLVTADFGSGAYVGRSVAIDSDGKIVVAGGGGFAVARFNRDGSLDTSFDGDGLLTAQFGSSSWCYSVAIDSNQRIVLAGHADSTPALVRLNSDGSLDTTFGVDGLVTSDSGPGGDLRVAIDSGGRIVVAGSSGAYGARDFAAARFNSDGSPDATFGGDGTVTADFGDGNADAKGLAIDSSGRVVVAGVSDPGDGDADFAVARFNSDGSLDTQFGPSLTDFAFADDQGTSVAMDPNGGILVAGSAFFGLDQADFAVARFASAGGLDTTFGVGGKVTLDFGPAGLSDSGVDLVVVQPDDKIVSVSSSVVGNGQVAHLTRRNPDGTLDLSFGTAGRSNLGFPDVQPRAIARQPDGRIIVLGYQWWQHGFTITRVNSDGTPDTTFGRDGSVDSIDIWPGDTPYYVEATDLAIDTTGKIVVAGAAYENGSNVSFLARFSSDGGLDTTFDEDGLAWVDSRGWLTGLAIGGGDKIIVGAAFGDGPSGLTVTRFNWDGSLDTTFGVDGVASPDLGSYIYHGGTAHVAIDDSGRTVVATTLYDDWQNFVPRFAVARLDPDGNLDVSFDGDGVATTDFGTFSEMGCEGLAIDSGGRAVAVGFVSDDFAIARFNSDGSLDATFDGDGLVTADVGAKDWPRGVAIDSADNIVVIGESEQPRTGLDSVLLRFDPYGIPDFTFGDDGKVIENFGPLATADYTRDLVAIQPDGKLVVAGTAARGYYNLYDQTIALVRYNNDGSLDTSFGVDGKTTVRLPAAASQAAAVGVQADGKILVLGSCSRDETGSDFALARLNPDGTLDLSFGEDGSVITDLGSLQDFGASLAIDGIGKIMAAAFTFQEGTGFDVALVRYNSDGSLDASFGDDGAVTTDFASADDYGFDVACDRDGKILVAGTTSRVESWERDASTDFIVARYNIDGSLDVTFDEDGRATSDFDAGSDLGRSVVLDGTGKIILAGTSDGRGFALTRLNADGSRDSTFGADGQVITDFGWGYPDFRSGQGSAFSVALDAYDRIVAVGSTTQLDYLDPENVPETSWVASDFALARYFPDGSLDPGFGNGGMVTTDFGGSTDVARAVIIDTRGDIVVAGTSSTAYTDLDFALARYLGVHDFPIIARHTPSSVVPGPIGSAQFQFELAVDPSSFSLADDIASFMGPAGPITATGYSWLDARTLEVTFAPQTAPGRYEIVLGPDICNSAGRPMDQDRDLVPGEVPDDQYQASFTIGAPRLLTHAPAGTVPGFVVAMNFGFDYAMDQTSFSPAEDIASFTGPQGAVQVTGYRWADSHNLLVSFHRQNPAGRYEMVLGPNILDLAGNALDQDADRIAGEVPDDTYTATFIVRAPRVLKQEVVGGIDGPTTAIRFTFDLDMDGSSFRTDDDIVRYVGPAGPVQSAGWQWLNARTLEVGFQPLSAPGTYEMQIGPGILSSAGNPMDQDGDLAPGETPDDAYTATFVVEAPKVTWQSPSGLTIVGAAAIRFGFDRPMDQTTFSWEDVASFAGPGGPLSISGYRWIDPQTLEVTFPAQWSLGDYEMVIGPGILDRTGIALDQDGDLTAGEIPDDQYVATFEMAGALPGTITSDTVFNWPDQPIVVGGPLMVAAGATLTIQAGTILKFPAEAGLFVNGTLDVRGTYDAPVILTSWRDDTAGGDTNDDGTTTSAAPGDWSGISMRGGLARLDTAFVQFADIAISAYWNSTGSRVVANGCQLTDGNIGTYFGLPLAEIEADNTLIARNQHSGIQFLADNRGTYRNVTIVDNGFNPGHVKSPVEFSSADAGGVRIQGSTLVLENSIVAWNANGLNHWWGDVPNLSVRSSLFYNPAGQDILWDSLPGLPDLAANGNGTADPLFVDRAARNYELAAGSPAVDSGQGIHAPQQDLLGRSRYDDQGMPNVGNGYPSFVDMGAYERQADTLAADLAVTYVASPEPLFVAAAQSVTIEWIVTNNGTLDATGTWQDKVYLSNDPYISPDDLAFGTPVEHTGPLTPGESYTASVTAAAPSASGPRYILVRTNANEAVAEAFDVNNVAVATKVLAVDVPLLQLSDPRIGAATQGQWQYYRFEAEPGRTVRFSLDGAAGTFGVYLRRNLPPTLSEYDVAGAVPNQPDQEVRLLDPVPGTYFVGVYAPRLPGGPTAYTLSAAFTTLDIREVTPNRVGNAGPATIKIVGDAFVPDSQVELIAPDGTSIEGRAFLQDSATLFATFDLETAAATAGNYDVAVANPASEVVTRYDAVTVLEGGQAVFHGEMSIPSMARPGRVVQVWLDLQNRGTLDAAVPLMTLVSSGGTEWLVPESNQWVSGSTITVPASKATDVPGILRPGEKQSILVKMRTPFAPGAVAVKFYARSAPAEWKTTSRPINWSAIEAALRPAGLDSLTWDNAWSSLVARTGDSWADVLAVLERDGELMPPEVGCKRCLLDLFDLEIDAAAAGVSTSISGTVVTDDPSLSVSGQLITARNAETGDAYSAYSLRDGSFHLPAVAPGAYVLACDGCVVRSGQAVTVSEGEALEVVELRIEKGVIVTGAVRRSANRSAISGAQVVLSGEDGTMYQAETDASGAYSIKGVLAATYNVRCEAPGMALQEFPGVVVGASGLARDFSLEPESLFIGTVSLEAGGPVLGMLQVSAQPSGISSNVPLFPADTNGLSFEIDSLSAGTYDVRLVGEGYISQTVHDIAVGVGQQVNLGVIPMFVGGVIRGTLTSSVAGQPVTSAVIGLFTGESQIAGLEPDSEGHFAFYGLEAGTYSLRVVNLSNAVATQSVVSLAHAQEVTGVSLQILRGASIVGTVRDSSTGLPLSGTTVVATRSDDQTIASVTNGEGAYRFDALEVGEYLVQMPIVGAGARQQVTVDSIDGTAFSADFAVVPVARLKGQVLCTDGSPMESAVVRLVEADTLVASTRTGQNGDFLFILLSAGVFSLQATAEDASFRTVDGIVVSPGEEVIRNFTAGSASLDVTIQGLPAGSYETTVRLFQALPTARMLACTKEPGSGDTTSFANLVAGNYEVEIVAGDDRGAAVSISVSEGMAVSVTADVSARHHVSGQILDASGGSLANVVIALVSTTDHAFQLSTISGSDGLYDLSGVPDGTYDLVAWRDTYNAAVERDVSVSSSTVRNILLDRSATQLLGRLASSIGEPVPGGVVTIRDAGGHVLGEATSQRDGSFAITSASGDSLELTVNAPGSVGQRVSGIAVAVGSTVDVGNLLVAPVALGCQVGLKASVPGGAGEASGGHDGWIYHSPGVPGWLATFFQDYQRRMDELRLGDVPALPQRCAAACGPALGEVVEMLKMQDAVFRSINTYQDSLNSLVKLTAPLAITEFFIAAGNVLKIPLLFMTLPESGLVVLSYRITEVVKAIDSLRGIVTQFANAGSAQDARGSVETGMRVVVNVKKLMNSLVYVVLRMARDPEAIKAFGGYVKFWSAVSILVDLRNTVSAITFTQTRDVISQLIDFRARYESAIWQYERVIARAHEVNDRYIACLRRCQDEDNPEDEDATHNYTSYTPEDKFGLAGYDPPGTPADSEARWIPAGQTLDYRVEFWNKEDSPVPTQDAVIEDILDLAKFDPNTLQFTRIGFLNWDRTLPGGQAINTRIDLRPDMNVAVDVTGTFDPSSGKIRWWFHCVDPVTGDYPEDPMAGFLPPFNPETGYEIGWVEFRVSPREGLPSGTQLPNQAFVEFDFAGDMADHPAPKARPWVNTIDAGSPSSQVVPLPDTIDVAQFLVQWSGEDDQGGSGIGTYAVFVSDNGGPFTLWQDDTTDTSAPFTAVDGHTYAFYSVATDNVGHREAAPLVPDARTTFVSPNRPPTDVFVIPSAVHENLPGETVVGTLSTVDPDNPGDSHTYGFAPGAGDADNAAFAIVGSQFRTAGPFDYETKSSYSIRVRSTDAGKLWVEKALTIGVIDVNETPAVTKPTSEQAAMENVLFHFSPEADTFTDPDAADVLSYTATRADGAPLPDWLMFDAGTLTFSGRPTFTDAGPLAVLLRAQDRGTPPLAAETTFTIVVQENPTPWRNPDNRWDVNVSGLPVEPNPQDVLVTINFINLHGTIELPQPPSPLGPKPYVDNDGDGWARPSDVLALINVINARIAGGPVSGGESEPPVAASFAASSRSLASGEPQDILGSGRSESIRRALLWALAESGAQEGSLRLDVNGTSWATLVDALVIQNRRNRQTSDAPEGEAAAPETTALLSGLRPKDAHGRLERRPAVSRFELEEVLTDIADDIRQEWSQIS